MIDAEKLLLLEKHLKKSLSPDEKILWTKLCEEQPELKDAAEEAKLYHVLSTRIKEQELHSNIQKWKSEINHDVPNSISIPKFLKYVLIALTALTLIFLSYLFFKSPQQTPPAEIEKQEIITPRIDTIKNEEIKQDSSSIKPIKQTQYFAEKKVKRSQNKTNKIIIPETPKTTESSEIKLNLDELSEELFASVELNIPDIERSEHNSEKVTQIKNIENIDSEIQKKNYSKALSLLEENQIDDLFKYPRLAKINYKLNNHSKAIEYYKKYKSLEYDTDKTDYELLIYYLGDIRNYKEQYCELVHSIFIDAKHAYIKNVKDLNQKARLCE